MPLTPYHLGPGLLVKALLRGSFSLMVFGLTQVLIDLQPLLVIVTGQGVLHGFTHTYTAATVIGLAAAAVGKPVIGWLSTAAVSDKHRFAGITWPVALFSALLGSYSHVAVDSIMHPDVHPFAPFASLNGLLGAVPAAALQSLMFYSGVVGIVLYFAVRLNASKSNKRIQQTAPKE